jgi:hypothetical protein
MSLLIPKPISGGVMLSYHCNSSCLHCIYACSPEWKPDWMSKSDLEKTLSQLAGKIQPSPYGADTISLSHGLHFSGGEPFLNFDLLCQAVEIAHELKIPSTFVETNCSWCNNDKETREKMMLLKSKGLTGIMLSTNPFYLEHVPFERTERAVEISQEIFHWNSAVYQIEYFKLFQALHIKDRMDFSDYAEMERKANFHGNVEFFYMGRACYETDNALPGFLTHYQPSILTKIPCNPAFARSWHNHFDNYNNYIPGFCAGISFGDIRELDTLLKNGLPEEEYPVLTFLIQGNFAGLLEFAQERGFEPMLEGYVSKCHLCLEIRKHLVTQGGFKELEPVEFYNHI